MSEFIRLQANGVDAYPDASTENTYRSNGTSVESALLALESNVNTLGGVAGEAKTLAEQNSVKIATAEQEISDINSSLDSDFKIIRTKTPVTANENIDVYHDTSLINNYVIVSVCYIVDGNYITNYLDHIKQSIITSNGINLNVGEYSSNRDCIIILKKIS